MKGDIAVTNGLMKYLILLLFIFLFTSSYCQTRKVRYDYSNGSIMASGYVITCPNYDKRYLCDEKGDKCKKIGKWIYYYQNGTINRVENYKRIKDCSSNAIRDGIWQYFNEQCSLIKEEEYKDDILWKAEISKYYFNQLLAGEINVRNGVFDTVNYIDIDSSNLIKNGAFWLYLDPPQLVINNGQNHLEDQIPFWITPNGNTPDYYNQFRKLSKVPDNFPHEYNAGYNYVGIILYHEPSGTYSEYITGELNSQLRPNRKYVIEIQIRLSQNSGYYIDKFGVYLSKNIPALPNTVERQQDIPQIVFNKILDNRDTWITLCEPYTAIGDEKYITFGRFSGLSETTINKINPINQSEGEYNQSAYYLINKVELFEDSANCLCNHINHVYIEHSRIDFGLLDPEDSLELNADKTFVLKRIYFDFDKSILLPASFPELQRLSSMLKSKNISITISGHTDNIGTEEYNNALSLSRAKAVSDWLIERGIDSNRILIQGYGAKMPIVDNTTDENRAINRRVEFIINKK